MSAPAAEAGQGPSWPVDPSGWLRLLTAPEDRAGTTRAAAGPQQWVLVSAIIGLAALVAIVIRIEGLLRSGFLTASWNYDDAVFLGSSIRLLGGVLPYRDFVLIVPPGATLLLTPFAALSRLAGAETSLVAARATMPFVSGANVVLLGLLLRRRSPLVVLVACSALAFYPDSILTALTVMLEPFLDLFCLLGAVLLFDGDSFTGSRRRLVLGGFVNS